MFSGPCENRYMKAILICPAEKLRKQFEVAIGALKGLALLKVLPEFPPQDVLRRIVRARAPQVVFIGLEESEACENANTQIETESPWIQRIGLHESKEPLTFRLALRLRMHEALVAPFNRSDIDDVLARTAKLLATSPAAAPQNHLFAFVPAKPGVGSSTIAANATWAFSRMQKSEVLLADFDLSSGVTSFLFKAEHDHQILDALSRSHELDEEHWKRLVKKIGNVDLLPSGAPCIPEAVGGIHVTKLVEFIRRSYDIACADLPDTFDEISLGVLRDADRIILVTSSELPAIRMARLKACLFEKLDLADKVRLVVNRVRKSNALKAAEIEEAVGLPVFASFPCDYSDVSKSIQNGTASSALAHSVEAFTAKLLDKKVDHEKRHRFIERFAITPMRYAFK
jgi:pilus assembly protein CpaE